MRFVRLVLLAPLCAAAALAPVAAAALTEAPGTAGEVTSRLLAPLKALYRVTSASEVPDAADGVIRVHKIAFGQVRVIELRPTASGTLSTDTLNNPHFRRGEETIPPISILENGNWRARSPASASSIMSLR